ncbi:hypothetical protein A2697_05205 [Candidatus Curtissbacteria bacterium RIFCSPHIGHO2_01_FULL_41_44]|uniref:Probable 2-phosphosulfolactate phosphatase n=1 Tax=Candidatus Curtissbacteria bacterium RIFCSPLOWO2_01_FULL_42_50 TaxID=1797730 RepID=A0A1F5H3L7_9BACT|nr:MAG: hypothetical protein A2697_05205 [Candidatus Curtissbacteria bacterium RIFCSPHIGHO2_01_FULL_41_44]OGD93123.1 MAG: hypothetical protein A3C33_04950 [Candidatus Curtissbacteria bacterium RIFCSPHIGHO2_02_FULL_42_58]OGD96785.1 MAG: hypothetical protein A3E71_01395 [Candidatus Curtissbacteria bacterium RIFCSPHIGHO2_12_FULL_42_33]OGD98645.1 MAG: hypothetical protein A3B54_02680 [Candidatus Curtissbacteria bacterium RIFCSPLOWO2_01_FULL_42_50]OGE02594.1 MAG: hypothetical protein A3G16_03670 [Ca
MERQEPEVPMIVKKRWFLDFKPEEIEIIRQNRETVVVVDLWAATTNIVLMLAKKPQRLILVSDDKFPEAEKVYPQSVLIGQSKVIPEEKFASSSNKSSDVDKVDIAGKVVLYVTFNGTRVLEAFSSNEKGLIFAGSMTNLEALVLRLRGLSPSKVNVVASGNLTGEMGGVVFIEDFLGAEIIEKKLKGQELDFQAAAEMMKQEMLKYYPADLEEAEDKVWPYIFGQQTNILPTAFINNEGFVEAVRPFGYTQGHWLRSG